MAMRWAQYCSSSPAPISCSSPSLCIMVTQAVPYTISNHDAIKRGAFPRLPSLCHRSLLPLSLIIIFLSPCLPRSPFALLRPPHVRRSICRVNPARFSWLCEAFSWKAGRETCMDGRCADGIAAARYSRDPVRKSKFGFPKVAECPCPRSLPAVGGAPSRIRSTTIDP